MSTSLFRGCFWTDFSMNNHNFSNFWFFENVILTYVKLMILHNQQAVPRLQIHRFVHDYLLNFCIEFSCFFMIFRYRFRDWFLITFLMENGSKKTSKIDPWGDLFGQKGDLGWVLLIRWVLPVINPFLSIVFSKFVGPLSAPFCSMLGPFGYILALVGSMLGPFGSILGAFSTLLAESCKK